MSRESSDSSADSSLGSLSRLGGRLPTGAIPNVLRRTFAAKFFGVVLVVMLVTSSVGAYNYVSTQDALETDVKNRVTSTADLQASGLGDDSFNDMAHAGVKKARDRFGITFENAEPASAEEIPTLQREFASATDPPTDLVCGVGFAQASAIVSNATEYPDQQFLLVDGVATDESGALLPNVANYVFAEHQGSFQVGHLAGLMSMREFSAGAGATTDGLKVGFVGGVDVPLIRKFEAGFRAGVAHATEAVEVESAYAGSFADPDAGEKLAGEMYADGVDIIYHAAGGSGTGVFRAAQEAGRFAIGVDNDQSLSAPEYSDVILASMVKHVDKAVFRSIVSLVNRKFRFRVGTVNALGLLEGGVRAAYGTDVESAIPEDVTDQLDASRRAILRNEIEVPSTLP